ncbi:MAG: replicative DNA helicase [Oscillospiraceae bacterium]
MNPLDELLSRQLPHSTEAEQSVLGAMLIDENCVPDVIGKLKPEDFYLRQNRALYESMYTMFNFSQKIDLVTVLEALRQSGNYDENSSRSYLQQLMEITPTAANVGLYVDIVKDKALLRRIAETAGDLTGLVQAGTDTGNDLLEVAEQRVYALRQGRGSRGLEPLSAIVPTMLERLGELAASGNALPGLSTGIKSIDRALTGLNKSDLIILAARPGMGKTSLALNMALYAGKYSGKNVAVFSLEMSKEQLGMRLLSGEAVIENKKLLTGQLDDSDWVKVAAASQVLSHTQMYIDDDPTITVADINAKCRRVDNLGLVVVDYLQLMGSAGGNQNGGESRQQAVSNISRAMKIMAKELAVPVVCLSQLSRSNEKDKTSVRRPRLSDLRDSGAIEQDADIVMFLHRESDYDEGGDDADPNSVECIIAKNRHGETNLLRLKWLPQYTSFSDSDEIDYYHSEG